MLTIEDLNRINKLPSVPLNIDEKKIEGVLKFREKALPFVDNLNLFTVDFINRLDGILKYWYMLQNNPWLKDKCVIGLMGAYNAGKSTLLNCLLGINLPIGINPVTAVPTYIAYGFEKKHYLVDSENVLKEIPDDLESRLSHEETNGFNLRKIIANTVLYNQSAILKKVTFLDTPGISADNDYDYETTANAASKCDVVLWAIRAGAGSITQFELEFIKEYLSDKKLYIVITHADRSPNPDNILRTVLQQLEEAKIDCAGSFFFGLRTTTKIDVQDQLNKISQVFNTEARCFKAFQPQVQLDQYLAFIQSHLDDEINNISKDKLEVEKICREYEHHIETIKNNLINDTNSLSRSISNLKSTIDSRCRSVGWCTVGAYNQLVGYHNSMVHSYNDLVGSINELDIDGLITYGKAVSYLSRLTERLDGFVSSRNTCVELISESKNLLK